MDNTDVEAEISGEALPGSPDADLIREQLDQSIPDPVDLTGEEFAGFEAAVAEASSESASEPHSEEKPTTDKEGTVFDPEIHRSDASGNPVVTKKGLFAKKPGSRSRVAKPTSGGDNGAEGDKVRPEAGGDGPSPKTRAEAEEVCQLYAMENATMTYGLGTLAFGPDGGPNFHAAPKGEFEQITAAWKAHYMREYLRTGKLPERSPLVMIAQATGTYALTRIMHSEKSQTRLQKFTDIVKRRALVPGINWFKSRFSKKKARQRVAPSVSPSGGA